MMYYIGNGMYAADGILTHFGIKGQKWGVRRYQNPDGSLTDAGLKRYSRYGKAPTGDFVQKYYQKKANKTGRKLEDYQEKLQKRTNKLKYTDSLKSRRLDKKIQNTASKLKARDEMVNRYVNGDEATKKAMKKALIKKKISRAVTAALAIASVATVGVGVATGGKAFTLTNIRSWDARTGEPLPSTIVENIIREKYITETLITEIHK